MLARTHGHADAAAAGALTAADRLRFTRAVRPVATARTVARHAGAWRRGWLAAAALAAAGIAGPPAAGADRSEAPGSPLAWSAHYHSLQGFGLSLSAVAGAPGRLGLRRGALIEAGVGVHAGRLALGYGAVLSADRWHQPAWFGVALKGVWLREWRGEGRQRSNLAGIEAQLTGWSLKLAAGCLWPTHDDAGRGRRARLTWTLGVGY